MILKAVLLFLFSSTFIDNVDCAIGEIDCSGRRWTTTRVDNWTCNMDNNEIICDTVITDCSEGTMGGEERSGSWGFYKERESWEWDQVVGEGWDCRC